jgi:hypothetical protein
VTTKRLLAAAGFVAALLALVSIAASGTLAHLSAKGLSPVDTLSTATVTVTGQSPTGTCSPAALVPNGTATTCSLQVGYSGTAPAWMGLDVFIATKAGGSSPLENLYNPGAADNPPVFTLTDSNSVNYSLPTAPLGSCPASGPLDGVNYTAYSTCYDTFNLLVSKTAFSNTGSDTFTLSVTLATNNGSNYQGGKAVIVIRPHVVQSGNNGATTTCTAGAACSSIVAWS